VLFLIGEYGSLVEAGVVNCAAESAERFNPLLTALVSIEEVPDGSFDELICITVLAGRQFPLYSLFDIWGQIHVHGCSSCFDFTTNGIIRV